jgi:alkylation response protein AidB-like acyl-CoA dehydrogenase
MDLSIPLELRQIQEAVRDFVLRELAPLEAAVDEANHIDDEVMSELRQRAVRLGVYGFNLPVEVGGGGVGPLGEVLIGYEVGRTSIALAEAVGRLPQSLAAATADQVEWLVKPATQGQLTVCVALTEPDAGSDLGALRTRAEFSAGKWSISGSKQFISQAETSDYILVLAVTDPEASLRKRFTVFAVDRENPGLAFTHRFRKLGWHGYPISAFSLDQCFVDESKVLGGVGNGFDTMMSAVNGTRLFIAARCVGSAQELLRLATVYANQRSTFGVRLSEHQAIEFMLADMDVEVEAARMLVYRAAWAIQNGSPDSRITTSRAKLYATEMACRAADSALQIFGGAGFMADYPVERMYRDLRGYRIGEGSSEMQRIQIARHLLKRIPA